MTEDDANATSTHCYFTAVNALLVGDDPLEAALHHIRPGGGVTFTERDIAEKAAADAVRDYDGRLMP